MLSTLPNLFVILITLVAGTLAARISKKALSLIGLCCMIAAGIGGYLFHSSMGILYIYAILIGIGMGLFSPMVALLINERFMGPKQGQMLGLQTSFNNLGAIILSLLSGFLGAVAWHIGYLTYVIVVVPIFLIVAFCLPSKPSQQQEGGGVPSTKINGTVIYYTVLCVIFIMVYNVYATNVAMFTLETGLGSAATAGIANSIALIGGIFGGLIFGKITSRAGKMTMVAGMLLCCIGFLLTYISTSLTLALVAAFIAGASISLFMPQVMTSAMQELADEYKTMGLSIIATFGSLGAFLSPIVFTNSAAALGDTSVKFRFLVGGIVSLVLTGVLALLLSAKKKRLPLRSKTNKREVVP
ncbi:MAG: MFS transporter [Treponema sp.]|nr:MFS transporter [Treponema sp.]